MRNTLSGMAALIVGMSISRFAYTPILPHMLAQGAVSHTQGALLASINLLGYLIGALAAALPALRTRSVSALRIALIVNVAMLALMLVPHNYALWMAARLLSGISSAFIFVFASTIVLALRKPAATTALFSSVGIGIALTGVVIPFAYWISAVWQTGWIVSLVLAALLSLFAIANVSPPTEIVNGTPQFVPSKASAITFWLIAIAYGFAGFSYVVPATFLPTIMSAQPALAPLASASWVIVGVVAACSILAWTPLATRFGKTAMLVAALLLLAIGCAAPALAHNTAGALTSAFGLGGSFMAISMLALGIVRELDPARSSTRIAQATLIFSIGQVLGPLFTAYSYEHTRAYGNALLVAALALVLAAGIVVVAVPRTRVLNRRLQPDRR